MSNACFRYASTLTRAEAERILGDVLSPECLVQAAAYVLSQPEEACGEEERENDPADAG